MADNNNDYQNGVRRAASDTYTFSVSGGDKLKPIDNGDNTEQFLITPAVVSSGIVIYPYSLAPLLIDDEKSVRAIDSAVNKDRLLVVFPEMPTKKDVGPELKVKPMDFDGRQVSTIGILVRLVKTLKFPDGSVRGLVRGLSRVRFLSQLERVPCPVVRTERIDCLEETGTEILSLARNAAKVFQDVINLTPNFPEELKITLANISDSSRICDLIADAMNISYREKLLILTTDTLLERLLNLTVLVNREAEMLLLSNKIQNRVHESMNKQQRDYFLREQLREIHEELGDGMKNPDIASIMERLEKSKMPKTVRKIIEKEVERLDMIPQASGEYNIAYTYIDWLLSVPWKVYSEDRLDVIEAARILDEDHYGLKDVKQRILEFLSVLQLKQNRKSPIVCFVGPPGVGKTSLGKSIASAMGRKFIRMSLGGIHDEAEIRGHRRTYIGALPGRIIQGMKRVGTSNPVFMLDELDKLGNDQRGDPASALLEVLDPQQNKAFNDHYLEVDYDLSSVMFIATANMEDTIPRPLLDRMEIIRLPGYTAVEKHQIAKRYLIPRQMKENGLHAEDAVFTRNAVDEVINYYTMESGVRTLERTFGKVCRRIAKKIVEHELEPGSKYVVDVDAIRELLGPQKFIVDETENIPQVGVATGMAWTSVGGSTLQIETSMMPGKGELKLTGSLGNVMKESAQTAFSYIRSNAKKLKIDNKLFDKNDFHIHVPDGATPKDGPSAGITLTTALVSLLTNKPVLPHLSMTGEITLRGHVTPIGGVKEKVIAALRAGVTDIIMPERNRKDLEDVPEEVKEKITFHFVTEIDEVLTIAIPEKIAVKKQKRAKKVKDEIYEFVLPQDTEDEEESQVSLTDADEEVKTDANPDKNDITIDEGDLADLKRILDDFEAEKSKKDNPEGDKK